MFPVRSLRPIGWLLPFAAAACQLGGAAAPIPFAGPTPRTILIWPRAGGADLPPEVLLAGLDPAVRRRGYEVVPSRVANRLLADAGLPADSADHAAIAAATAVDAVLRVAVHRLEAQGEPLHSASWEVSWELRATPSGAELWRFVHQGYWQRREPIETHPHPRLDDDQPPVLFGAREPDFRNLGDLMVWLHAHAVDRLPPGGA
ncbi:MAG: hypothetical protein KF830_15340 [Planctomycetes bacterium]|nr:hypothetical protein [Planctomycetota bacterium]